MTLVERPVQSTRRTLLAVGPVSLMAVLIASCDYGPPAVTQPRINPTTAGRLAMEYYDTNGDGRIAGEELETAPSLKAALARLDTDSDGGVTAEEVAARIGTWKKMGVGLTSFRFQVLLNGSPLAGADVIFEPAPFLGDEIQAGTATTDESGLGIASVPKEQRPSPTTPPGMALGLYEVRITKSAGGQEQIPARYNRETVLGQEVAFDVPEIQANRVIYELRK